MSKPFLSELSLEEHKAYERLVEVMPREFEKLGALCDAANVAVRDSARQALTFFLNQDILSVARPVDHAAASKVGLAGKERATL